MGLETGTFVSDLTSSNPLGTDVKSQGDDHIRLTKAVLQGTFPDASKAFYFPDFPADKVTTYQVLATDENKTLGADATGGVFDVTLIAASTSIEGFRITIVKMDSSANAVTVEGSGAETINGAANRTLSSQYQSETYVCDGVKWIVESEYNNSIEAGTTMIFHQDAAPTGWTKDVASTLDNHALRIVTSTAWSSADSTGNSFTSVFGSGKTTGNVTLTWEQSGTAAHNHSNGSYTAATGSSAHTHEQSRFADAGGVGTPDGIGASQGSGGTTATGLDTQSGGGHTHDITGTSSNNSAVDAGSAHNHTMAVDVDYVSMILATKD